ncbi:peptide/nickel transport system ATP-binding protein [Tistlia consotensis]|uniref:Peptide/nickel transport system ATP-binding protein n=1 Tax=Tistlia consotensis USBA 355 TaxID=560819 RepID=A0A1Y6BVS0_9PROT|nr:oligopeptide/dipeptide ABC transporter ATP-binding protein [Tistlia consotensis]SMF31087.1 peptide/nickel transport system ATP-binding protein [Tistlia consotensis USBA 355]SNS19244.1 peptide/nickel transport system ATP-binding protein [Tistlia consotensis]
MSRRYEGYLTVDGVSKVFGARLSAGDRFVRFLRRAGPAPSLRAVSDVSLSLPKGQTLGLVGESGCGKSTLGRIIAGIYPPSSGTVTLDGEAVMEEGRKVTTDVQTVFQDPFASLDPRMKVGDAVAEGPVAHGVVSRAGAREHVSRWFARVGLDPSLAGRYPHQFSGGQRQRIAIARALAMNPKLLICDEPVASLDVSIQAQVLNLFLELRRELDLTCVFISHDLSVVRHVSDRVAVMYLGRIVELGETERLFRRPAHPYTAALLDSVPRIVADGEALVEMKPIEGEIPSPLDPPPGCHFAPRCPRAVAECSVRAPLLREPGPGRSASCHFAEAQLALPERAIV